MKTQLCFLPQLPHENLDVASRKFGHENHLSFHVVGAEVSA
jgi:hypothetical protein